jgi:hypothetical protein
LESQEETCAELGEAVVLSLSLMLDPLIPALVEVPLETPLLVPPRWKFELQGALTAGVGLVPGLTAGGRGLVLVDAPWFLPVLAEGELIPFARLELGGQTADLSRMTGGLQLCPLNLEKNQLLFRACTGVDAGLLFVLYSNMELQATEWALFQSHTALRLRWQIIGPLIITPAIHILVPFRHFSVMLEDETVLYRPWPVAGLFDLGLGLAF